MNNQQLSFSVIIPLYNKEKFILNSLRSLLNQSMPPNEIIIINDCSKDRGYELAKEFAKEYQNENLSFILQENPINSGPGTTRNNGIKAATSNYVLFLDADDLLSPNHIKNLYDCIMINKSKLLLTKVLQTSSKRILPSNLVKQFGRQVSELCFEITSPFGILEKEMIFVSANYCFEKKYFEKIEFSNERNFEDWLFCYKLLRELTLNKENIWLINEPTYLYTEDDPESLSSNNVKSIDQLILPQLYYELMQDQKVKIRKYIFSIWLFSSIKRCSNFSMKLKFMFKNTKHILSNIIFNKYYLSSFLIVFISRYRVEKLIQIFKK